MKDCSSLGAPFVPPLHRAGHRKRVRRTTKAKDLRLLSFFLTSGFRGGQVCFQVTHQSTEAVEPSDSGSGCCPGPVPAADCRVCHRGAHGYPAFCQQFTPAPPVNVQCILGARVKRSFTTSPAGIQRGHGEAPLPGRLAWATGPR